jgi:hypothetical protein
LLVLAPRTLACSKSRPVGVDLLDSSILQISDQLSGIWMASMKSVRVGGYKSRRNILEMEMSENLHENTFSSPSYNAALPCKSLTSNKEELLQQSTLTISMKPQK